MQSLPLPCEGKEIIFNRHPTQEKYEKEAETTNRNNNNIRWYNSRN